MAKNEWTCVIQDLITLLVGENCTWSNLHSTWGNSDFSIVIAIMHWRILVVICTGTHLDGGVLMLLFSRWLPFSLDYCWILLAILDVTYNVCGLGWAVSRLPTSYLVMRLAILRYKLLDAIMVYCSIRKNIVRPEASLWKRLCPSSYTSLPGLQLPLVTLKASQESCAL